MGADADLKARQERLAARAEASQAALPTQAAAIQPDAAARKAIADQAVAAQAAAKQRDDAAKAERERVAREQADALAAENRKKQLLAKIAELREEETRRARAQQRDPDYTNLDQAKIYVDSNQPGNAEMVLAKVMGAKAARDYVHWAFPQLDTDPAVAATADNLSIFARGTFNTVADWTKNTWDWMRTEHPMATQIGTGLIGGLVGMRVLGGVIDNSLGKIPFIGGLLGMLAKLVSFVGIGLGAAGLMGHSGLLQSNSGGSNTPTTVTTITTPSGASVPPTGARADDTTTDHRGNPIVRQPANDRDFSYTAGQDGGGRRMPSQDMIDDGPHLPSTVRRTDYSYETLRYDNDGGDATTTYVQRRDGGYTPPSGPDYGLRAA